MSTAQSETGGDEAHQRASGRGTRRTAVITGGSGFVGSHLARALIARDWRVVAVDNFITGHRDNVADLQAGDDFELIEADVIAGIPVEEPVDAVLHLASPASPPEYLAHPIETLEGGASGTRHALDLARRWDARFLLASTSEVYGDPLEHPQPETYWGNVNTLGPRAVYDESKRYAEALTMAYQRTYGVETRIVRIFNTYGPGLRPADGRVISNFLAQAMAGAPITVYGDGSQTRSFCYVTDQVRGMISLLESDYPGAVNIGNPNEFTVLQLAEQVLALTGSSSPIVHEPLPEDDPRVRRPDITLARHILGWHPEVELPQGLERVYEWYRGLAR